VFSFAEAEPEQYDSSCSTCPPSLSTFARQRLMGYSAQRGRYPPDCLGPAVHLQLLRQVSAELFEGAVLAAAIEAGRPARILHRLTQLADHPVFPSIRKVFHLKGLVLAVE
jgi:23S rRNA (cytosine1962-C5)-methyltransferase